MAHMLSKAAHIINILSVIPGSLCAYIVWIFTHNVPHPPEFVSLRNMTLTLFAFVCLYLLSVLLGFIALLSRGSRPTAAQSS